MSIQAENWFRVLIRDLVRIQYQANGGYLDGTMTPGDADANVIKFPIAGRVESYKLTGAIQMITTAAPDLSTVQVTPDDFEASAWYRTQDIYKSGPSEKDTLVKLLRKAIERRKDWIKLDALQSFMTVGSPPETIGDGSGTFDILDISQLAGEFAGAGVEGEIFLPVPAMWMEQLKQYKEFANADYVGPADLPIAKRPNVIRKTWSGITIFTLPDEYFNRYAPAGGTSQYTWAWSKDAMGSEERWDDAPPSITEHPDREGSPYLVKSQVSGAAIGIMAAGVRRLHFKKLARAVRPAA